jgi:hypothetical protein
VPEEKQSKLYKIRRLARSIQNLLPFRAIMPLGFTTTAAALTQ